MKHQQKLAIALFACFAQSQHERCRLPSSLALGICRPPYFKRMAATKVTNNLGEHPRGVLIITPDFRFMIIETGDGRKPAKTMEELAALQRSKLAYSGLLTFATDPDNPQGLVMSDAVDIAWNEEWLGTRQKRRVTLNCERLQIINGPSKNALTGEMGTSNNPNNASPERHHCEMASFTGHLG